jgi:hypothetical protein
MKRPADNGDVEMQFLMGKLHLGCFMDTTLRVDDHPRRALVYFHQAARQGHAESQANVGVMHEYGDAFAVGEDLDVALKYTILAEGQDYIPAVIKLAGWRMSGTMASAGFPKDLKKGKELQKRARRLCESGLDENILQLIEQQFQYTMKPLLCCHNDGCDKVDDACLTGRRRVKMRVCNGCNKAHYCSVECQTEDWSHHKSVCTDHT